MLTFKDAPAPDVVAYFRESFPALWMLVHPGGYSADVLYEAMHPRRESKPSQGHSSLLPYTNDEDLGRSYSYTAGFWRALYYYAQTWHGKRTRLEEMRVMSKFAYIVLFIERMRKGMVYLLMRGARARWKIENETFNTLKNQGYHFEHNFGHGNKNLSTVFAYLMVLAFLIDQVQSLCCKLFEAAMKAHYCKKYFWEKPRGSFMHYFIDSWEDLYSYLAGLIKGAKLTLNTS